MNAARIETLALEASKRVSLDLRVFSIEHVPDKIGVWVIQFSDKSGLSAQVSIDLHDCHTDDAIVREITRQLAPQ